MSAKWVLVAISCAALLGCQSPMMRGVQAYDDGCYPESIEKLMEAEHGIRDMSPRERTRYSLYRGLAKAKRPIAPST